MHRAAYHAPVNLVMQLQFPALSAAYFKYYIKLRIYLFYFTFASQQSVHLN